MQYVRVGAGRRWTSTVAWILIGALIGLILGGATSWGQLLLPHELGAVANSVSGWTVPTFVAVSVATRWPSAANWWTVSGLGTAVFHGMLQGYVIVSTLRGHPDSYGPGDFYFSAACVGGPLIGLAAWWQRSPSDVRRALGIALLGAILAGEGVFGLTQLLGSTSWVYWTLDVVGAVLLLGWAGARRLGTARSRVLAVALTALGAATYVSFFVLLSGGV